MTLLRIETAIDRALAELERTPEPGIPTGIAAIDRVLGGLEPVCVHLVAGRSGCHHLLETLVANVASSGAGVLYVTTRLHPEHVALHLLAGKARVASFQLQRLQVSKGQQREVAKAAHWLIGLPIVLDGSRPETASELMGVVEDAHEALGSAGLRLVAVDDFSAMPGAKTPGEDAGRPAAKLLRRIARRHGSAVVAAYHLEDNPTDPDDPCWDKLPSAIDMEADATLLIAGTRRPDDWPEGTSRKEVLLSKSRIGAGERVRLRWWLDTRRVEDVPAAARPPPTSCGVTRGRGK